MAEYGLAPDGDPDPLRDPDALGRRRVRGPLHPVRADPGHRLGLPAADER